MVEKKLNLEFPLIPRFSLYSHKSNELRGYINNYQRGKDEICRISPSSFSTFYIATESDLKEYLQNLHDVVEESAIIGANTRDKIGIEELILLPHDKSNKFKSNMLRSSLKVEDYEATTEPQLLSPLNKYKKRS